MGCELGLFDLNCAWALQEYESIFMLALVGVLSVVVGVFLFFGYIILGVVRRHKDNRWNLLTFGVLYATCTWLLCATPLAARVLTLCDMCASRQAELVLVGNGKLQGGRVGGWLCLPDWAATLVQVVMLKRLAIVLADGLIHPDLTPFKFSFFVLILVTYLLLLAVVVPYGVSAVCRQGGKCVWVLTNCRCHHPQDPMTNLISLVFNVMQFLIVRLPPIACRVRRCHFRCAASHT